MMSIMLTIHFCMARLMIPEFNRHGELPKGIHDATLKQIRKRYAITAHRTTLYECFEDWVDHMRAAGCQTFHLDGSFITSKHHPGDYDALWDARGVDLAKIDPCLLDYPKDLEVINERFAGDIFPDYAIPEGSISFYLQRMQRETRADVPRAKGIVRLSFEANR